MLFCYSFAYDTHDTHHTGMWIRLGFNQCGGFAHTMAANVAGALANWVNENTPAFVKTHSSTKYTYNRHNALLRQVKIHNRASGDHTKFTL